MAPTVEFVAAELAKIDDPSVSLADKPVRLLHFLQLILEDPSPEETPASLKLFLNSALSLNGSGILAIRPVLTWFVKRLTELPPPIEQLSVCQHALGLLHGRGGQFAEQDTQLRLLAADLLEASDQHTAAANVLSCINLESSQRVAPDDEKLEIWIRIMRNYLEDDDTTSAEAYLNKCKGLIHNVTDAETKLNFQLSQARISDARRQFLPASQAYHALSLSSLVVENERLQALASAIVCGVLAPAGPQRSRTLAHLYRDERATSFASFPILSHMFLGRLVSATEVSEFANSLSPHHLAPLADGSTALAKAVIEHNLLASPRLYDDITCDALGRLLNLPSEEAEGYAARMIEQGRLSGRIDQIDSIVYFEGREGTGEVTKAGQADQVIGTWLRRWDGNVKGVAEEVERVVGVMASRYPDFVERHLELYA